MFKRVTKGYGITRPTAPKHRTAHQAGRPRGAAGRTAHKGQGSPSGQPGGLRPSTKPRGGSEGL